MGKVIIWVFGTVWVLVALYFVLFLIASWGTRF
jgi:hypothetical protein